MKQEPRLSGTITLSRTTIFNVYPARKYHVAEQNSL